MKFRTLIFLFLVTTGVAPLANGQSTPISMSGTAAYTRLNGDTSVRIEVERLTNTSATRTSGTLFVGMWATPGPSPIGSGFDLAQSNLSSFAANSGRLAPGASFTNISTTVPFTRPPAGEYYIHIYVSEFPNSNTILDSITIGTERFASTTGIGGGGGGGGGGSSDFLLLSVLFSFVLFKYRFAMRQSILNR